MRSVSAAFIAAIAESHRLALDITLTTTVGDTYDLPLVDGTVTLDQRAATRGRCDLTLQPDDAGDLDLIPSSPADLLAPYGNEISIRRGVEFADGTRELAGLGVFRIEDVEIDDDPSGQTIRLFGLDRSARLIEARFEEPYQVAAGTNYVDAIAAVLAAAYPSIVTDFTATSRTTPSLVAAEGDDRWAFAQTMARSIGHDLYFDGDGTAVTVPTSVLSSCSEVAALAEGAGGVLLSAGRRLSRTSRYNRVVATGENTGQAAPVRGVATDDDPASPTYYYGPYGKVPRFYASPFITTTGQAQDAAASILAGEAGSTASVNFGALVNPALEPGDVVRITRGRSRLDELHVIDQLTIPLSPAGIMTGATRSTGQGI